VAVREVRESIPRQRGVSAERAGEFPDRVVTPIAWDENADLDAS
jgi:hypothetical protein